VGDGAVTHVGQAHLGHQDGVDAAVGQFDLLTFHPDDAAGQRADLICRQPDAGTRPTCLALSTALASRA
jgi:hypothetical protein